MSSRSGVRTVTVVWEITRQCMLACRPCREVPEWHASPRELTFEESRNLLGEMAEIGLRRLVISGGDPASRGDLLDIVREADRLEIPVTLSPSATPCLLNLDFAKLRWAGVRRMALRFDGGTEESHDEFRGIYGSWSWTMEAVKATRAAGIPLQINTMVSRRNMSRLPELSALVARLDPVQWRVFVTLGDDALDAEEMEHLLKKLVRVPAAVGIPVKTVDAPQLRRVVLQSVVCARTGCESWRSGPPQGGREHIFVGHEGEIRAGGPRGVPSGNVRENSLRTVWEECEPFRAFRDPDRLCGKCGRCEYRRICGGSRDRAFAATGDYLAEDPACRYEPRAFAV